MLLYQLHTLALRLLPLRPWCLAGATLGIVLTAYALFESGDSPPLLLRLSLALTLWMLMLFSFLSLFQRIPSPVLPHDPWWERVKSRTHLAFYHLLALLVALTSIILLSMSLKLLATP